MMTWTQMAKRPVQLLPKVGGCPLELLQLWRLLYAEQREQHQRRH
jgi:hypothetical protein